jgi:drug/metabolite transporter (DMT)-like permease
MNRPVVIIPLVALVVILGTLGQTALKYAINSIPAHSSLVGRVSHLVRSGWFYAGFALAGAGFVGWLSVLMRADLSFAVPFLALGFPMILLSSAFILHEPVGLFRVVGTLLVTIGMFMVALS